MATLTLDIIRKKAEHHSDTLFSLQELSLHQLNLAHLTPILSQACPNLRILYLHNNLLPSHPTFKQLHRLHSLTYLNLTLNNITTLPHPHLASLEKLTKLDLTLNHIPCSQLTSSLAALGECVLLRELYLVGNPCMTWSGCRMWVVGSLSGLMQLDGKEVTRSERLEALQERERLSVELQQEIEKEKKLQEEEEQKQHPADSKDDKDEKEDAPASDTRFTPALRMRMYEEQQAADAKQAAEATASSAKFTTPPDLYTQARSRLSTFLNPADYSATHLPSQRNIGRYPFTLESGKGTATLRLSLPRHLDSSVVRVDVQPWWVQVDVRGQLLVLHVGEEVAVDEASVRRVVSDGSLVVRMPLVRKEVVGKGSEEQEEEEAEVVGEEGKRREKEQVVVVSGKGQYAATKKTEGADGWEGKLPHSEKKHPEYDAAASQKDRAAAETNGLKELSVTRSVTLEATRQMEQAATRQRQEQKKVQMVLDDDDVPPLI